jgi:multiple sugar transport system permease protein
VRRSRLGTAALTLAGVVLAMVIVSPFLWTLSASLQTETAIAQRPPDWIPQPLSVENYRYVFTGEIPTAYEVRGLLRSPITQEARVLPWGLRNSVLVGVGVVLVNLILGAIAAYTLAREKFRGRILSFYFILGSRLLPPIAVAIPTYMILRQLGLLDTKIALVLVHSAFTLPLTIWVLTMYFRVLPEEIEQAALLDGCSRLEVLRRIVVPMSAPGLAAVAAFSFLFSYSEFLFALLTTSTPRAKTIPVMIAAISGNPDASYTLMSVGIIMAIVPALLFALVFRRYITSGLVRSLTY